MKSVIDANKDFFPWIVDQYNAGAEIASLCVGAFLLAATGLVAVPSIVVINSDFPSWITQLGGILTYAISALVVHGCTLLIATDSPYRIFTRPRLTT